MVKYTYINQCLKEVSEINKKF